MTAPNVNREPEVARDWFFNWLDKDAWRLRSPRKLVTGVCERLVEAGVPLKTFNAFILILHPNYFGVVHRWERETGEVRTVQGTHDLFSSDVVQKSPNRDIHTGADIIRHNLEGRSREELAGIYAVLADYADEGGPIT